MTKLTTDDEARTLLDLIREEARKDNSPLGRSDSLALRNIRTALGLCPTTGKELEALRTNGADNDKA